MLRKIGLRTRIFSAATLATLCVSVFLMHVGVESLRHELASSLIEGQTVAAREASKDFNARLDLATATLTAFTRKYQGLPKDGLLVAWFGGDKPGQPMFNKGTCLVRFDGKAIRDVTGAPFCSLDKRVQSEALALADVSGQEGTTLPSLFHEMADGMWEPYVVVAVPVMPERGNEPVGVIMGGLSLRTAGLSPLFKGSFAEKLAGHDMFLVSGRTVVQHQNQNLIKTKVSLREDEVAAWAGQGKTLESAGLGGEKALVTSVRLGKGDLTLVATRPLAELTASLDRQAYAGLFRVALAALMGFAATMAAVTWLMTPLGKLTRAVKDSKKEYAPLSPIMERYGGEPLELAHVLDWRANQILAGKTELANALKRYEMLAEHSSDLILRFDSQGSILFASKAAELLVGRTPRELLRLQAGNLVYPGDWSEFKARFDEAVSGGESVVVQHRLLKPDSAVTWVETALRSMTAGAQREVVGIMRDIAARKAVEDRLNELAHHDSLTGLGNRILLTTTLAEYAAKGLPHAALLLDLDKFKRINDTFGHDVGDSLLKEAGRRLRGAVRSSDLVCRLGGDEFVVVVKDGGDLDKAARNVALKILDGLDTPIVVEDHTLQFGCSIGIARYPEHGNSPQALLHSADEAMYEAKARGGRQFVTFEGFKEEDEPDGIASAVRAGSLDLAFLPVMSPDGHPLSLEALVRWRHPARGTLTAKEFLPEAEKAGVLGALENWTLHETMSQVSAWRQAGLMVPPVAINVSGRQLLGDGFPAEIAEIAKQHKVPLSSIWLDITEPTFTSAPERAEATLVELAEAGVRVTIDDFGKGYTVLSHLAAGGLSAVKIGPSLWNRTEPKADTLTQSVFRFAKSLGLAVVAKGVESVAQRTHVERLGADATQGTGTCPELAATEVAGWLASVSEGGRQHD